MQLAVTQVRHLPSIPTLAQTDGTSREPAIHLLFICPA